MSKKTQEIKPEQGKDRISLNPFPGLRPFGLEESHLFFGREGQSEEVLRHLAENRFVAVIGLSSGFNSRVKNSLKVA